MANNIIDLTKDDDILSIKTPRRNLRGPWTVVYKDVCNKWAIVALHWKTDSSNEFQPCLGIRWFWNKLGTPSSRSFRTWLIIPNELDEAILNKLPLSSKKRMQIDDFLNGKYCELDLTHNNILR